MAPGLDGAEGWAGDRVGPGIGDGGGGGEEGKEEEEEEQYMEEEILDCLTSS